LEHEILENKGDLAIAAGYMRPQKVALGLEDVVFYREIRNSVFENSATSKLALQACD
jgi:hypothetical protein